jgi:hypothetical protein
VALTDDEKGLLEKLLAKDKEADANDSAEIEIYDTKSGKGARIPYAHGRSWLFDTFGIGEAPAPKGDGKDKGAGDDKGSGAASSGASVSYFGGKKTG